MRIKYAVCFNTPIQQELERFDDEESAVVHIMILMRENKRILDKLGGGILPSELCIAIQEYCVKKVYLPDAMDTIANIHYGNG